MKKRKIPHCKIRDKQDFLIENEINYKVLKKTTTRQTLLNR
jgi:hypothetical protein